MIKISGFHSILHNGEAFNEGNKKFINDVEASLGEKLISAELQDYSCDLKLIFIESGGSEGLFLKNMDKLQEPYYFLTSGSNNSLAASLEIMTYLNLKNKEGEILHGSPSYIASRIRELLKGRNKILSGMRIGVFGTPSDWLIASVPAYKKCEDVFGVKFVDIPLSRVEDKYNRADFSTDVKGTFDKKEIQKADKLYHSIKSVMEEEKLSAMTIRCFDLLTSLHTTGCLSLSRLNDEGLISSCEGDIMSLISMMLVKKITEEPAFQANPSRMDTDNNEIVFAHCTLPLTMTKDYHFDTHFESGTGVAIKGELMCGECTIFRISSDLRSYFISEGEILQNLSEPDLCRTQIRVHLDADVKEILRHPSGNHHIIFYGHHKKEMEDVLKEIL